jgi:pilus assembly protein FimV
MTQFNRSSPIMSSALKTLTAAVASAVLVASSAHAAGLGKLTVLSALGQPLRAEIELTAVSDDEASGLLAKLASPESFRVANIEFNPALLSLRFAVEHRAGRQFIKISSTQPLNEPFVDMLLELSWNNGKLVREYTFLLDPAELRATQAAQVAPSEAPRAQAAVQQPPQQDSAAAPPAARRERPVRAEQPPAPKQPVEPKQRAASEYRVKPGDTLGRIAGQLKPADISLDMMLVALYRANPDSFIGHNMNRLRSGEILSVPDDAALHGTGQGEAHGVVVAHAADFNAYRNKLAGQVASSEAVKAPQEGQSAAGKITAKVEERPTAANEAQDQLRLSKATPAKNAAGKGAVTSGEDLIAKEKALADAQARVKELEKNVNDLEHLVTVKNRAGSEAVANAKQAAKPATPAKPVVQQPAPQQPAATAAPVKRPVKASVSEPSLADTLMDNITYIGGAAAIALLAAFGLSQRRKRKETEVPADEPSLLGVPTEHTHSLFAEAGGQSVDTNNSVFNSSFAPSASQLDTNEVDPVAEADVYIAYGRDAQAEEILKEALRAHPDRFAVRLKLLEIYAARKDQRAFETQASELYSHTRGQGDEWAQAAALGLSIDPLNPLYAGTGGAAAPAPTEQELGQQALLSKELDQGFGAPAADNAFDDFNFDPADEAQTALPALDAVPERSAASEPKVEAKAADEHVLDFDLGGLSFEPVSTTEPIAMPGPAHDAGVDEDATAVPDLEFSAPAIAATEAAPAADNVEPAATGDDESFDLAFDMNFDAPAATQAPAPGPDEKDDGLALDMSLDTQPQGIDMADLAREFDLPELPRAQEDETPAGDKDPLFDLDTMDFSLPESPAAREPAASIGTENQQDDPFALPDLPAAASAGGAAAQFDLSDIDLDLPGGDTPAPIPEVELAGARDNEMSAAHMEMETKLDLAIAYQEIGDKEGARELLDEVINGGSTEQVSKATALRDKLA